MEAFICPDKCHTTPDTTICTPGLHTLRLTDRNGCDSTVELTLVERLPDTTLLEATICSGDTLRYRGSSYFQAGGYPQLLSNRFGCDSLVDLQLTVAACPLDGTVNKTDVACHDGTDGGFRFSLTSGAPPYRYDFRRLGGGPTGNGTIAGRNESTNIEGLPPGTYLIEVTDDFGSVAYFNTEIERPPPITAEVVTSDRNGFPISCAGAADGQITATARGGTGKLSYTWARDPTAGATLTGLGPGEYSLTVTDARDCTTDTSVVLREPPPLTVGATAVDEICDAPATGRLTDLRGEGGTGSVSVTVDSAGHSVPPERYTQLPAGQYRVVARDDNGCTADTLVDIDQPQRPTAAIAPAGATLELGETVTLSMEAQPGSTYGWTTADSVICTGNYSECAQVDLRPFRNTYYFGEVTSPDGCTARDTVLVRVVTARRVYVPSAFSPNGDGRNDLLTVFPGRAVRRLRRFQIFDRWGGLSYVIEQVNTSTLTTLGWNGVVDGQQAPPGVYAWTAEVEFIDGQTHIFRGAAVLIR